MTQLVIFTQSAERDGQIGRTDRLIWRQHMQCNAQQAGSGQTWFSCCWTSFLPRLLAPTELRSTVTPSPLMPRLFSGHTDPMPASSTAQITSS